MHALFEKGILPYSGFVGPPPENELVRGMNWLISLALDMQIYSCKKVIDHSFKDIITKNPKSRLGMGG